MDSPEKQPVAIIKGTSYEVKFSLLAQLILDQEGVDTTQLAEVLKPGTRTGKLALIMKLFAAGAAHCFVKHNQKVLTAEEWAMRAEGDPEAVKQMVESVLAAILKPATPTAPAPATDETPALAN